MNATLAVPGIDAILDFDFFPWGNAYWNGVTHPTNKSYYHCWVWGDVCGAAKHTGGANPNYPDKLPSACYPPAGGALINQHGPNEGQANLIEGCTKKLYPSSYWDFVVCYEAGDISRTDPTSPVTVLKACAAKLPWLDTTKVLACANDPSQATAINVANAKATNALNPAHTGTPWITVNGVSTNPGDLLSTVCKAYNGTAPLPAACHQHR